MRVTSKGQVTIPVHIRERAGLLPNTEVEFEYDGDVVRLVRAATSRKKSRGERLIAHLRAHRRREGMSTEEIMALTRGD
jgi:AbrB family looped-hinge helix DNA binding protein